MKTRIRVINALVFLLTFVGCTTQEFVYVATSVLVENNCNSSLKCYGDELPSYPEYKRMKERVERTPPPDLNGEKAKEEYKRIERERKKAEKVQKK